MTAIQHWLALAEALAFKPHIVKTLYDHFQSIDQIIHASDASLQKLGVTTAALRQLRQPTGSKMDEVLRWLEQPRHHLLTLDHPDYPPLLKEISDPPTLIYIDGNPAVLKTPQIAIVGSRNPTPSGIENAHHFATALAKLGITITSGLALGVDAASHRGALSAPGQTIAALGNGLHHLYPKRHRLLADAIINNGALISEFPLSTQPLKHNFPLRNRIISGLSIGTLVIEATVQSGSLITARKATAQGREVFAIPGNIHNPLARGCHYLIQSGAKLVESVDDILTEVQQFAFIYKDLVDDRSKPAQDENNFQALSTVDLQILNCVDYEMTAVDQVIKRCGLDAKTVTARLLELELSGHITATTGGYSRVKL